MRVAVSVVRRLGALFAPSTRLRFLLAVVGSLLIALMEMGAVLAVLPLMELVTGHEGSSSVERVSGWLGDPPRDVLVVWVAALVFLGFLVKGVAGLAIRWWTLGFFQRQSVDTAATLMSSYLQAPYSLHQQRDTSEFLRRMNDAVGQVYSQVVLGGMSVLTEGITIAAMAVTLFVVAPVPALTAFVFFGLAGALLQRLVRARARRVGEDLIHAAYVMTQAALHALGGIREIKLRREHQPFVDRFRDARSDMAQAVRVNAFLGDFPKYAMELLFIFGIGLMTIVIYSGQSSDRALGTLALFAVAGFRVLPSIVRLMASLTSMRGGAASLRLVEEDLARARELLAPSAAEDAAPITLTRELVLDRVGFVYEGSARPVLQDVSLRVPAGSSLALVGGSGAGKSTLVDVVLGLHPPSTGRVLADGVDVSTNLAGWQAQLAAVPQDVFILGETLRQDIVFSIDAPVDEARLDTVLEQAQLRDLVTRLEHGLDTPLGERGARISGGQRQRIGIARALYRQPRLLALDEATSALDNATEREITDTLESLRGEVTTIVVAHRLSTVRRCDQVAYLVDGRVDAVGSWEEMLTKSPGFAHLVSLGSLDGVRRHA